MVRGIAIAGGELRFARAHRHRTGAASSSPLTQPHRANGSKSNSSTYAKDFGADSAEQWRVSGSDAADKFCGYEPGGERASRSCGDFARRRIFKEIAAGRRQLADRHKPGN